MRKTSHTVLLIKNKSVTCIIGVLITFVYSIAKDLNTEDDPPPMDVSDNALISERENVDVIEDSNVAEALARRPDLQFNNVTIDGERSNLSLDDIPADAIETLEVLRAVTPDMDADSRGGSLNLSSNPAFKLEAPIIKSDTEFTYSQGEDTWEKEASLTYGQALDDLGFRLTLSHEDEQDIMEGYYLEWEKVDEIYVPSYLNMEYTDSKMKSYAFNGAIDYRISEAFYLFVRSNFDTTDRKAYQPHLIYKFYEGDRVNPTPSQGTRINAQVDRDLTVWESEYERSEYQFGGVYEKHDFKLDFRYLREKQFYIEPDWTVIQFRNRNIDLDYELNNQNIPIAYHPELKEETSFIWDEYLSERWKDESNKWIATINSQYDFEIGQAKAYLKAGFKYTSKEKDQSSDSYIYTHDNSGLGMDPLSIPTQFDSLLIDEIHFGSFPGKDNSRNFLVNDIDSDWYNVKRSAQKGDPFTYIANEDIRASFLMLNVNYGKLRSIVGLRDERTELDYQAREVEIDSDGHYVQTKERLGKNEYNNLFPSFHLRYFVGNRTTVIGSWTQTIKRPFYGDIVPYRSINYDSKFIKEGNPELKPTVYENLDVSIDYKLSESSLFSLEFFKKDVDDIVFWEVKEINTGVYSGFTRGTHENGPNATEHGIRFILTQDLYDWWQSLDGWSFIVKLTLQNSETQYPTRPEEKLPVTYRPKRIVETTLTYDQGPIFAQLQYSKHNTQLQSVYGENWEDVYSDGKHNLDLSTSYQINDKLRLFFDMNNLLHEIDADYYGIKQRPSSANWRSRRYRMGLKLSI